MSKRFGRNQKRAMRNQFTNQLNELHHSYDELKKIMACKNRIIDKLTNTVDLTAEILGQHFISLPVKTVEVKYLLERYEYAVRQPVCSFVDEIDPKAVFVDLALCYIDTYQADARLDEITGNMHMRYKSISGNVAYGVSNFAWNTLSEKRLVDMFTEQIANKMAVHLVRERKKSLSSTYHLARN